MSELISIGKLCNDLNQPMRVVRQAVRRCGVKPSTSIDGILYFAAGDVPKIDEAVRNAAKVEAAQRQGAAQ